MAGCAFALLICIRFDHAWLLLLPALLPIVDLAPWTGWLSFEEFDILALGAASGAWLRHGWAPGVASPARTSLILLILVIIYLALLCASFALGINDAGDFEFGWFQGYESAMNSLRLAKSFVLAALFAPLLGRVSSRLDPRGAIYLGWGMALGLTAVSLAVIWERTAFPGLLNFSADYRTTALFWEMHVGGAALDGFLVLTFPFAVLIMLRGKHGIHLLPATIALGLGVYASLTTFSRGVYLASAASLALMALMLIARRPSHDPRPRGASIIRHSLVGLFFVTAAIGLTWLVFRHGGYRATLAILGCLAALMLTMDISRSASAKEWAAAIATAILLSLATFALTWVSDKGAYWSYALLYFLAAMAWVGTLRTASNFARSLVLASTITLPIAAALVANHWGGSPALGDALIALVAICLLAMAGIRARQPLWPSGWRRQGIVLASAASISAMVAVFSGGAYMGDRFATSERDLAGRLQHWRAGLDLLQSPGDWLLGRGLGRFPASFFFGAPGNEFPGSYKLDQEGQNKFITLSGPRYQAGFGEVLRISQRIDPGQPGRYKVEFDVRTLNKVRLNLSVCTKHLLYAETCAGRDIAVTGTETAWQHRSVELAGHLLTNGTWYAPQLVVFSLAIDTMGEQADIDNLVLTDQQANSLLVNADFSYDMARWFLTSDHHHMPWHMKNMFLHVLFEQGILGLAAFLLLVTTALFRSLVGRRSHHPLAPALIAAICGFLIVGMFDSLLDVPRVSFLFFLLLLLGIQGRKQS